MLLLTEQPLDFYFRFGELRQGNLSLSRTFPFFISPFPRIFSILLSWGAEVPPSGGWAVIFVVAGGRAQPRPAGLYC